MDAFGVLIFQVIGQQLSVAATRTMLGRLLDRFGGRLPTPEQLLAADPEDIRAAGLSRRKVATLWELAGRFVDGRLDPAELAQLPDEEVVAIAEAWRPYRSLAVNYLFASVDGA